MVAIINNKYLFNKHTNIKDRLETKYSIKQSNHSQEC